MYYTLKRNLLLLTLIFGITSITTAQKETNWETYIVKKDKGLMSVTVNMDLNFNKPNYKNLLIVGTKTNKCFNNGHPMPEGLEKLYTFSDSVATIVDRLTKNKLAGIITYQCVGFDVFYVKDTLNLRDTISKLYAKNFSNSKNYLVVENDKKWEYYRNNLFPKELDEDFFINHEFLSQLVEEGDDLAKPRELKHWAYFTSDRRRTKFIDKIKNLEFNIDSVNFKKGKKFINQVNSFYYSRVKSYPYEVKISRKDSIDPKSISELTKLLKVFARNYNGKYDGWGIEPEVTKAVPK